MMKLTSRLDARRLVSLGLVVSLVAGLVWVAATRDGYVQPEPDLHDAGIWVTRAAERRIGRTNTEIQVVDTSLSVTSSRFEVLQDGGQIFVRQGEPSVLLGVDPVTATMVPGPELPPAAVVAMAGGTGAVLDSDTGALYVIGAAGLLGVNTADDDSRTATFDGPSAMAVGVDGIVHAVDASTGTVRSFAVDGLPVGPEEAPSVGPLAVPAITAVGGTWVVLDASASVLFLAGADPIDVSEAGTDVLLQQPGPDARYVLVAGSAALLRVDLATGEAESLVAGGAGSVTAPVHHGGCDYVAWGGNGLVARVCGDDAPAARPYDGFVGSASLIWRLNRGRILLNDHDSGAQLIYGEGAPFFLDDDWSQAITDEPEESEDAEDDTPETAAQQINRTENEPPIAIDDVAGTRQGRPVVVRPLRNDSDPDGDVLVILPIEQLDPNIGRVDVIDGGRALLVELAEFGPGRVRFAYTISDGYDHTATANVVVSVSGKNENGVPEPAVGEETTVVTGGTVQHDLLANAFDPDGDPLSVVSVTTEAGDVPFEASGALAFTATNAVGPVDVIYVLTDDRGGEASGRLVVNVVDRALPEAPVARSDFASTIVGREVVIDVLANDTDANGDELSIVRVDDLTGASLSGWPNTPDIRITADRAGTINLVYRITDGRDTAEGRVRVDVAEPAAQFPPVAVRDDVLLTPGVPAFLDVLANDVDQDGEVLVIIGASAPAGAGVDVQVVQRSLLRLVADRPLDGVVEIDYTITDGSNTAVGRVVAAPAPARPKNQPPVVRADEFTVRAGGIAVLPVLGNDTDPDGDPLTLVEPEPVDDATAAVNGRLFISDGLLRYQAPTTPKSTVILSSSVADTAKNVASGQLLIHVIAADGSRNSAPVAPTLVGRVLAGGRVAIRVPLATMDPEGDAVYLEGIATPPSLGAVVETRADELVYDADLSSSGTDQFTYTVRDQFGLASTGAVLVGIVGIAGANNDPVAVDDLVNVAPGTTVVIPALANDSDPDGDPISYSSVEDDAPVAGEGDAVVGADGLRFTAPASPSGERTSLSYVVSDGRGGRDIGTVQINFAPPENRPPLPVDDLIKAQEPGALFTTAPLQANDVDLDGDTLSVTSVAGIDAVLNPDGTATLTMGDSPLQFTYTVTDGTDERRAAVSVPLVTNRPPIALPDSAVVQMLGSTRVDVLENDSDPEGQPLILLEVIGERRGGIAEIDGNEIVFTSTEDEFVGDAGFAYRVADSADPTVAKVSVGVVQITINGTLNTKPVFTELRLEVPQKTTRTLDLRPGVQDRDIERIGESHTFTDLAGDGDGVDTSIDGTVLSVDASIDAAPGTVIPYTFTVSDGKDDTTGTVLVTVIGSDRPLPSALPDSGRTIQGQAIDIDVLSNDVNPFPETPLEVISVTTVAGVTTATDGRMITFTPDPAERYLGEVQLEYTVRDATGDTTREVVGIINVTVVGRPDIPAAPSCIGGESRLVQISWAPPAANGAAITKFVVRVSEYPEPNGGGVPVVADREFPSGATVQSMTELRNGFDHTFAVAAVNEAVVGDLEFSPPSPLCRPNQVPDQPDAPESTFGDGEVRLTFAPPNNPGSPITGMTLRNTTTGDPVPLGPLATEYTWSGLENGTSYRFTLTATNDRGDSDPSPLSTGDGIPAGVPLNPVAPTTEKGDRFLTVAWTRPDENGDSIVEYRITIIRAGVETGQVSIPNGNQFSTLIDTDNGVQYAFQLEARNKAGWSDRSPASVAAVSAGKPFAVPSLSATEGNTVSALSFPNADDNGAAVTRYEVSVNGGTWATLAGDRTVRGLSNGSNFSFRVRAVNSEGAGPDGPTSNTINPYGNPGAPPKPTGNHNGERTISWNWGAGSENGRPITNYEVKVGSGSWGTPNNGARSHAVTVDNQGDSATLYARAVSGGAPDPARQDSASSAGSSVTTPPPPSVSIDRGTSSTNPCWSGGSTQGCYNIEVSMSGFSGSKTVRCYSSMPDDTWQLFDSFTASNGTHNNCSYTLAGRWVIVVVDGTISESWVKPNKDACSYSGLSANAAISNCYGQWPTD